MIKGTVILWNNRPHYFSHFATCCYTGRIEAILEEKIDKLHSRFFGVAVKDAFNKMENQILVTL